MKTKLSLILLVFTLTISNANAQFVVTDPGNFAGNIANSIKEITTASKTVTNTMKSFKEVEKLYGDTKKYYDALKKVNNLIGDAYKVKETLVMVGDITGIYVDAYKRMLSDTNFRPAELTAMASGYTRLLELSGESVRELKTIVQSGSFSMNDKERMELIDRIYQEVKEYKAITSYYTRKNISVSYIRAKKKDDTRRVQELYGMDEHRFW
jgi:Flp pilus assembly CpaF family ATPase